MSFPFWVAIVLTIAIVAFAWPFAGKFIVATEYREDRVFLWSVIGVGVVLWLWIVLATRTRRRAFDGPIETIRGTDTPVQPVIALPLIVFACVVAYQVALPMLLHALADHDRHSYAFALTGSPATAKNGCSRVDAESDEIGKATLCIPDDILAESETPPGAALVEVDRSPFGYWPMDFRVADTLEDLTVRTPRSEPSAAEPSLPRKTVRPKSD